MAYSAKKKEIENAKKVLNYENPDLLHMMSIKREIKNKSSFAGLGLVFLIIVAVFGLSEQPAFQTLRSYALDNNLTVQQVQNATNRQIVNITGNPNSVRWVGGMKRLIIKEMRENQAEADKQFLKEKLPQIIKDKWPNLEIDRGRTDGKRYIVLWLNGKAE